MAVTFILTPDGRVSRYLYGVEYDPQTLRLSLVEAADGKIGSTTDQMLLFCFHYDAASGRYGPAAFRLMQLGGGVTVVVLVGGIWILRRREKARRSKGAADEVEQTSMPDVASMRFGRCVAAVGPGRAASGCPARPRTTPRWIACST